LAAAAAACVVTFLAIVLSGSGRPGRPSTIGDGVNVASYGFDLDPLLVDREQIVASGMPRDGLTVLDEPAILPARAIETAGRQQRGKLLVPHDRVVGVVVNGVARAYPLRLLRWHEVVNDTIAGKPILVSYSPLCDSVVVAERRLGDETLSFGVSGLLMSSNPLLYDRRSDSLRPSLWSQLQARAVAGQAAARGLRLKALPGAVTTWETWRERYPLTGVLAPVASHARLYRRDPYHSYLGSDILRFPVSPLPTSMPQGQASGQAAPPLALKDHVLAIDHGHERLVVSLPSLVQEAGSGHGTAMRRLGDLQLGISFTTDPPTMMLDPYPSSSSTSTTSSLISSRFAFWFAWYAQHPGPIGRHP
jgi:hypothetical protein